MRVVQRDPPWLPAARAQAEHQPHQGQRRRPSVDVVALVGVDLGCHQPAAHERAVRALPQLVHPLRP
eukprot:10922814-Alexandrium_andersonii.AAC.1